MDEPKSVDRSGAPRWRRRRMLGAGPASGGIWVAPQVITVPAAVAQGSPVPRPTFVAVGAAGGFASGGLLARSTDNGVTWTDTQSGNDQVRGIAYGG